MKDTEFRQIVEEGIRRLPPEFQEHLDNVEIIVADYPSSIQQSKMQQKYHSSRAFVLLGLYEGVPHGKNSVFSTPSLPARITLFRKSIEQICSTREDMIEQINRTLLHEIGHHFGMSDKELRTLGF
ncbi:MAG: metallopeptidase family protein [Pseudomonadota bacterium]